MPNNDIEQTFTFIPEFNTDTEETQTVEIPARLGILPLRNLVAFSPDGLARGGGTCQFTTIGDRGRQP